MASDDQIEFKFTADPGPLWAEYRRVREQLAQQRINIKLGADRSAVDSAMASIGGRSVNVKINVDRAAFDSAMASVGGKVVNVSLKADRAAFNAMMASVGGKTVPVTLKINRAAFDSAMASIGGKVVNVSLKANRSDFDAMMASLGGKSVNVKINVDRAAFDSAMASLGGKSVNVKINVDRAAFTTALAGMRIPPISLPIRVDRAAFRAAIANLHSSASRGSTIALRIDASQARREIDRIRFLITNLRHEAQTLQLRFDNRAAMASINALIAQLQNVTQQANRAAAAAGGIRVNPNAGRVAGGGFGGGGMLNNLAAGGAGAFTANMLGGGRFATMGGGGGAAMGMAMGGPVGGLVGGVAGAGLGAGADITAGTIGRGLQSLSDLQRYEAILNAVIPDQEKANKLLEDLKTMNLELPTVPMGLLADAATKLAGAGLDSSTMPEDIKAILDAAATSSDGVAIGTERVVRAIAQMKTNGKLLGEELNQLTETGIPAAQILVRQFGMSINDIKDASQKGTLQIDEIIRKLLKGFAEERGGALSAQAETLPGKIAALNKQFDEFAKVVAEPLLQPLIDALGQLSKVADSGTLNELAAAMTRVSEAGVGFLRMVSSLADKFGSQRDTNDLALTMSAGINSGELNEDQTKRANAILFGATSLRNRRQAEGGDALLSKQEVATFFSTERGEFVDPNTITDTQQIAITKMIDGIARRNREINEAGGFGAFGTDNEQRADAARGFTDNESVDTSINNFAPGGSNAGRSFLTEEATQASKSGDIGKMRDIFAGKFGESAEEFNKAADAVDAQAATLVDPAAKQAMERFAEALREFAKRESAKRGEADKTANETREQREARMQKERDEQRRNPAEDTRTPEQKFLDDEAERKRVREIVSQGLDEKNTEVAMRGEFGIDTQNASEEAIQAAEGLFYSSVDSTNTASDSDKQKWQENARELVGKIIDGEFQASNEQLEGIAVEASKTGDFETANKILSEIKRREESDREANKDEVRKRDEMRRNPKTDTRTPEQIQQEDEAKRKQIRDIASEGQSEEYSKKIKEGFLAKGTTTADEEAIKTADTLLFNAGREDASDEFKANRRKAAGTIVDKIIDGEFQASNEQMGSLADKAEQTGDAGAANKIRSEIKRREESDRIAAGEKQTRNQTTGLFPVAPEGVAAPAPLPPGSIAGMGGVVGNIGNLIGAATGAGVANVAPVGAQAAAQNADDKRFDKTAKDLPDAFKKFTDTIADPEIREMMQGASFQVDQVKNEEGGFDPRVQLKELQDMTQKRAVQTTDLAGLNNLVQGNIDEAVQREQQKKMLEAQEKIREFTEKQNGILQTIATNTAGTRTAVVGGR